MILEEPLGFRYQSGGCLILLVSISNSLALGLFSSFEENAAGLDAFDIFLPHDAVGGPYEEIGCDPCSDELSTRNTRWISTLALMKLPSVRGSKKRNAAS